MKARLLCAIGLHEWSPWNLYVQRWQERRMLGTDVVLVQTRQCRRCAACGATKDEFVAAGAVPGAVELQGNKAPLGLD